VHWIPIWFAVREREVPNKMCRYQGITCKETVTFLKLICKVKSFGIIKCSR